MQWRVLIPAPLVLFSGPRLHLGQQNLSTCPGLLTARNDLVWWENESVAASVAQFSSKAEFVFANLNGPVDAVSVDLVDGATGWSDSVSGAMDRSQCLSKRIGKANVFVVVGRESGAAVSIGCTMDQLLAVFITQE